MTTIIPSLFLPANTETIPQEETSSPVELITTFEALLNASHEELFSLEAPLPPPVEITDAGFIETPLVLKEEGEIKLPVEISEEIKEQPIEFKELKVQQPDEDEEKEHAALSWFALPSFIPPQPISAKTVSTGIKKEEGTDFLFPGMSEIKQNPQQVVSTYELPTEPIEQDVVFSEPKEVETLLSKQDETSELFEVAASLVNGSKQEEKKIDFSLEKIMISEMDNSDKEVVEDREPTSTSNTSFDFVVQPTMMSSKSAPEANLSQRQPPADFSVTRDIPLSTEHPQWGEHFSQQVAWLSQQNLNHAVIKLNPPELGPIEIRLHVTDDTAQLAIQTQHQPIKELLEQTLPQLQEMMSSEGISLTQVNIETANHSSQGFRQEHQPVDERYENHDNNSDEHPEPLILLRKNEGIVDYFA